MIGRARALVVAGFLLAPLGANAQSYAEQCIEQVGPVPAFSCADGVTVPITVDGTLITSETFERNMDCDRPGLLSNGAGTDGQCVPNSRILDLSTDTAQISVMCRQKHNRAEDILLYDEIDVIAHNPATGATCWFQAISHDRENPLDGALVASPTDRDDGGFWVSPEEVAKDGCGICHDNDPFMYSPFMGQVWHEIPANPLGPYFHVGSEFGFGEWPTETMEPRDNTCLGCHRIGVARTCGELTDWMTGLETPEGADIAAREFPMSHAMPPLHGLTRPAWQTFHGSSLAEIKFCCDHPDHEMCNVTPLEAYRK
ncbi:hypothetical protein [Litoreibacter roseus]|uniref:Cytochrome c-552/4 domain-containing protein n=1 Tax=Litoreibacter roseus TaxID=2601869 RepID=A0A6N6JCQ8_9RHOB|nr:hypothetical protein [Litoreibacter roseus]GFE64113.1 hypothetical protein KIN_11870 [Litoreibacter roseus]